MIHRLLIKPLLTLFRPEGVGGGGGGGGFCPQRLWAKPNCLGISMATIFWQACFPKFQFLLFKKLNKSFLIAFFKVLNHLMVFLFVLITFDPILDGFLGIWTNPEIQHALKIWPPFRKDYAFMTLCDIITSWYGCQRGHFQAYYLTSKSRCHSFYILGLRVTE